MFDKHGCSCCADSCSRRIVQRVTFFETVLDIGSALWVDDAVLDPLKLIDTVGEFRKCTDKLILVILTAAITIELSIAWWITARVCTIGSMIMLNPFLFSENVQYANRYGQPIVLFMITLCWIQPVAPAMTQYLPNARYQEHLTSVHILYGKSFGPSHVGPLCT